jgi:hypothetical protein
MLSILKKFESVRERLSSSCFPYSDESIHRGVNYSTIGFQGIQLRENGRKQLVTMQSSEGTTPMTIPGSSVSKTPWNGRWAFQTLALRHRCSFPQALAHGFLLTNTRVDTERN